LARTDRRQGVRWPDDDALIYRLAPDGIERVAYEDTEHYRITRDFLSSPERYFKTLFRQPEGNVE
jgi:hypothetical protein